MGTLYLVRHGQASFGADDYDQLSPLGRQQAVRLGEYLRPKLQDKPLEAVLMGSLKRHRQTWEGIAEGAGLPHTPAVWPGLNEYDSHALIESIHPEPLAKPDTPELYRHHFRLLREALQAWLAEHSDHDKAFKQMELLWQDLGDVADTAEGRALRQSVESESIAARLQQLLMAPLINLKNIFSLVSKTVKYFLRMIIF